MELLNPEFLIRYGGLTLLLLIVFAETGLFFGFFLPGDSLLFIAGLLSDSEYIDLPVGVLVILIVIAAVSGTSVGYYFGKWAGFKLKDKKENFFYKKHVLVAPAPREHGRNCGKTGRIRHSLRGTK